LPGDRTFETGNQTASFRHHNVAVRPQCAPTHHLKIVSRCKRVLMTYLSGGEGQNRTVDTTIVSHRRPRALGTLRGRVLGLLESASVHPRRNAGGAHLLGNFAKPSRRRRPQRRQRRATVQRVDVNSGRTDEFDCRQPVTAPSPTFSTRPPASATNIDCTVSGLSASRPSMMASIAAPEPLIVLSVNGSPHRASYGAHRLVEARCVRRSTCRSSSWRGWQSGSTARCDRAAHSRSAISPSSGWSVGSPWPAMVMRSISSSLAAARWRRAETAVSTACGVGHPTPSPR
jgi:hypothetical protein